MREREKERERETVRVGWLFWYDGVGGMTSFTITLPRAIY